MTEETTHDVDGLLRKNAELLGEVKALKAKIAEVEGERDTALADAAGANEVARQIALEKPIEEKLGSVFVVPWRVVRPLLDEHFDFALGEDGAASIKDKQGKDMALDGLWQAVLAIPDLAAMVKPARGGGAKGSDVVRVERTEPEKREKVASPFGLR